MCKICHLPCREAQQSECCGHIYCTSDINTLIASKATNPTCPICRSEIFVTYPNLSVDLEIQKLLVFCPNKDITGCDWTGKLRDLDKHYNYGKDCQTECENCGTTVKHKLLHDHITNECPCYCPYCDITAEREVISSEHKEKCHKFPITCPNNCGVGDIPGDCIEEHKKVCPLEMVRCEFHDIGCEALFPRKDGDSHSTDSVTKHLQLAQKRLTVLNKMVEDSDARYLESTETFTRMLSDIQERMRATDSSKQNAEVQTENPNTDVATSKLRKIVQYFTRLINNNIIMLLVLLVSFTIGMLNVVGNYRQTTTTCNYSLPTIQELEFHSKVSVVLYELIDQSKLSWHKKLHYWDSITTVIPVVLKFSDISKSKNSFLTSRSFFAFTNGYLLRLRIFPSGRPGIIPIGNYMSVYLDVLKGPHDDSLAFPMLQTFTVELLHISGLNFQNWKKEIKIEPYNFLGGCDASRVYYDDDFHWCGFSQFISMEGYDFKQECSCNFLEINICCYLIDDALYFRVHKPNKIT